MLVGRPQGRPSGREERLSVDDLSISCEAGAGVKAPAEGLSWCDLVPTAPGS